MKEEAARQRLKIEERSQEALERSGEVVKKVKREVEEVENQFFEEQKRVRDLVDRLDTANENLRRV